MINKKIEIIDRKKLSDSRGYFLKVLNGKEKGLSNRTGEIYLTMAHPNEYRGGHYHILATEWFTIVEGNATLRIEDIRTKEKTEIFLSADTPQTVMIPPMIAHNFHNESLNNFLLVAYSDIVYDPDDTKEYSI